MKRLMRDSWRTLLIVLLMACAAAIVGLGATVHLFTLQQSEVVEDSIVTLAVRHVHYESGDSNSVFLRDAGILETLNKHASVKVPALTRFYIGVDASVTPVYSNAVEGTYYNWSRDDEISRTVMTVTCIEDLGKDPYADVWYAKVRVDEVHLPIPFDIPETLKIAGYTRGTAVKQESLVPGKQYLLCGRYEDSFYLPDYAASYQNGQFEMVYVPDPENPPTLRLKDWYDQDRWMQYISSPKDSVWLEEAVRVGDITNRSLRLDCINDINRLRWFVNGQAIITEGRSFSQAEQDEGARVCLISRELAKANGLSVGDILSMTVYRTLVSTQPWATKDMLDQSYDTPDIRSSECERVTFEIIGIYTAPIYKNTIDEFVPNTVIAPYNSVALNCGRGYTLPIQTQNIILHNGQGDAFLQAVRDAGYPDGLYTIEETTYDAVKDVLASMSADSMTLLAISASVGTVMLIVVLALYARGWRKENAILAMLGTTQARIGWRMFGSLVVLTLLGSAAAFGGICAAKSYIEAALNSVYIGKSADFSAIRVGAFSAEGMTIGVEVIAAAMLMTAVVFLLIAAIQSIVSARKKVRECLFD